MATGAEAATGPIIEDIGMVIMTVCTAILIMAATMVAPIGEDARTAGMARPGIIPACMLTGMSPTTAEAEEIIPLVQTVMVIATARGVRIIGTIVKILAILGVAGTEGIRATVEVTPAIRATAAIRAAGMLALRLAEMPIVIIQRLREIEIIILARVIAILRREATTAHILLLAAATLAGALPGAGAAERLDADNAQNV